MEREEGDLDLRHNRRGGRAGGVGEGGVGVDVSRLPGLLKPPPLSLPLCLSLPEEEEGA